MEEYQPLIGAPTTQDVLSRWGRTLGALRSAAEIQGSPERTQARAVLDTADGETLILEQCRPGSEEHRGRVATVLSLLAGSGLAAVEPYLPASDGETLVEHDGSHWQLRRFLDGVALPGPSYIYDRWRGVAAARFLIELRRCSCDIPGDIQGQPFALSAYVNEFLQRLYSHRPEFRGHLRDIVDELEQTLFAREDELPPAFCHGDYHPMNIVWGQDSIRSVIDWEFCGPKLELYDAALMVGCLGMENPECMTGGMVKAFLNALRDSGFASEQSWLLFRNLVVAIRLAWLKEWFRHRRDKMIELEIVYMRLLLNDTRLNRAL